MRNSAEGELLALGPDKLKSALSRNLTIVRISGACWEGFLLLPEPNDI